MAKEKKQHPLANTPEAIQKREERRIAKERKQAERQQKLAEEQENLIFHPLSESQEERAEKKRELNAKYHTLRARRKLYLENRDLEKTAMTDNEVNEYLALLPNFLAYQTEVGRLLIEMLKYPNKRMNIVAYDFLDKLHKADKVTITFWFDALSREFAPNDDFRLMKKHQKVLKERGADFVFPNELKRHYQAELERLKEADQIKDAEKREMQIMRVNNRIVMIQDLLEIFKHPKSN